MSSSIGKPVSLVDFVESLRRQNKEIEVVSVQLLLESTDKVLETLLGKKAANLIKKHLNISSLSRDAVNFNPQVFSEDLKNLLGEGARFIELEIIRNFSSKYCS